MNKVVAFFRVIYPNTAKSNEITSAIYFTKLSGKFISDDNRIIYMQGIGKNNALLCKLHYTFWEPF